MSIVDFLCGVLVGMFLVLVVAWLSIMIEERKKQKQYEIDHDRFIQAQCDWILAHQPGDEELKEIFSHIPEVKGDDYNKMFENCEGNVKGCTILKNAPNIPQEVLEKNKAYYGIV